MHIHIHATDAKRNIHIQHSYAVSNIHTRADPAQSFDTEKIYYHVYEYE